VHFALPFFQLPVFPLSLAIHSFAFLARLLTFAEKRTKRELANKLCPLHSALAGPRGGVAFAIFAAGRARAVAGRHTAWLGGRGGVPEVLRRTLKPVAMSGARVISTRSAPPVKG